jgi:hypothetical protein
VAAVVEGVFQVVDGADLAGMLPERSTVAGGQRVASVSQAARRW